MKISIVGATGSIGLPTAFHIAAQGLADEVVMIGGARQNILKHNAMDISTAVSSLDIHVQAGSYEDMKGSDIVINTAGVHVNGPSQRQDMLKANVPFIIDLAHKINRYCPEAIVITATNPVGPLNYATYLTGLFERKKLIGYTLNDSFRLREMVARAYEVKVSQVDGIVIGEHGPTQVLLFSSVRIDGQPIAVSEEMKLRIRGMAPVIIQQFEALKAGRTAGWTCAVGLSAYVRAISENSGTMLPCSLVLEGEYNLNGLSMTVPAHIDRDGVRDISVLPLAQDETLALEKSVDKLLGEMQTVEEMLRATNQ